MSYEFLIESAPVNQYVDMGVVRISGNYWARRKFRIFFNKIPHRIFQFSTKFHEF